jgi:hypothetical protein
MTMADAPLSAGVDGPAAAVPRRRRRRILTVVVAGVLGAGWGIVMRQALTFDPFSGSPAFAAFGIAVLGLGIGLLLMTLSLVLGHLVTRSWRWDLVGLAALLAAALIALAFAPSRPRGPAGTLSITTLDGSRAAVSLSVTCIGREGRVERRRGLRWPGRGR